MSHTVGEPGQPRGAPNAAGTTESSHQGEHFDAQVHPELQARPHAEALPHPQEQGGSSLLVRAFQNPSTRPAVGLR